MGAIAFGFLFVIGAVAALLFIPLALHVGAIVTVLFGNRLARIGDVKPSPPPVTKVSEVESRANIQRTQIELQKLRQTLELNRTSQEPQKIPGTIYAIILATGAFLLFCMYLLIQVSQQHALQNRSNSTISSLPREQSSIEETPANNADERISGEIVNDEDDIIKFEAPLVDNLAEKAATDLATRYYSQWSDESSSVELISRLYAPEVNYYGSATPLENVMVKKRALASNWPTRRYNVLPETVSTRCADKWTCSVSGKVEWDVADPASGRYSTGISTFDLNFTGNLIDRESEKS